MFNRFILVLFVSGLVACQKDSPPVPNKPGYQPCYGCGWSYPGYHSLKTYTSEDWDYWQYSIGDTTGWLKTYTSEDWDYWQFNMGGVTGNIKTYTSEDWDNWQLTSAGRLITIRTYTSEDWDYWEIKETATGFYAKVRTYTSNDFDHWEVTVGGTNIFDAQTYTSNDWDYWQFDKVNYAALGLDMQQLAAVLFVPVYTSAIHQRGIDQ